MKKKIILFLFIGLCSLIWAEPEIQPSWLTQFMDTGSIQNQNDYYFGVGVSDKSQKEADNLALEQFGRCIETQVKSQISSSLSENNGKVNDATSSSIEINSEVGLKGISITNRAEFENKHYSMIRYLKAEYNKILQAEIARDIERKKILLKEEKEKNLLAEEKDRENIRKKEEKDKIAHKFSEMREKYVTELKYKFSDFFEMTPPHSAISFSNGELIPTKYDVNIKGSITDIGIEEMYFAYKVWLFELSLQSHFIENKFQEQAFRFKYQILPYTGDFYKVSASFGAVYYFTELSDSDFIKSEQIISPFIAANLTVADLKFSYISLYADAGKTNLGINNYMFYSQLKDRLSLILETNIHYNDKLKNRNNDTIVFQPGIRFKTTVNSSITFSYEENQEWNANLQIGF